MPVAGFRIARHAHSHTKQFLFASLASGGSYQFLPESPGDFAPAASGISGSLWVSGIADLNGDGLPEIITGSPGSDDKDVDAGRVYVTFGMATGGTTTSLGDSLNEIIIDGLGAGDHAGAAVGSIADLNGDGRAEILVGAPLPGFRGHCGCRRGLCPLGRFRGWWHRPGRSDQRREAMASATSSRARPPAIRPAHPCSRSRISTAMAGRRCSSARPAMMPAGIDAGAAYVVFGKAGDAPVNLTGVAAGTGGFGSKARPGRRRRPGSRHADRPEWRRAGGDPGRRGDEGEAGGKDSARSTSFMARPAARR